MRHLSVLLAPVIDLLSLRSGAVVLDGTLGSGGHAEAIIPNITGGTYIGLDLDQSALSRSREMMEKIALENKVKCELIEESFRNLDQVMANAGIEHVDAILLDLGWSSEQFEQGGRGFSFQVDEPLLMTLSSRTSPNILTASEIVNTFDEEKIADLIYVYGEEQFSRRIARGIVEARRENRIVSTFDLVNVIEKSVPAFYLKRRIHSATKTFQALRIAVNDELGALKDALRKSLAALSGGGRIAIITFHSLEDRIVKQMFREWAKQGHGKVLTKKPIVAGREEIETNRRARSAKLRGFEKAH